MTSATSTKKILITGSEGFIGSELLAFFTHATGINIDIRNKETLSPHFKDIDFVINAAAKVKKGIPNPEIYYPINVLGTKNVVELCIENNAKLIHLSSVATEGPYGLSKQLSQQLVESYAINDGLKAVNLRLCVIYNKENDTGRRGARCPIENLASDIEKLILTHDFDSYKLIDYEKYPLLHIS